MNKKEKSRGTQLFKAIWPFLSWPNQVEIVEDYTPFYLPRWLSDALAVLWWKSRFILEKSFFKKM